MICVIDTETGGLQARYHEAISICILPLKDDFSINTEIPPFKTDIRPTFPDRLQTQALKVNGRTVEELAQAPVRADTLRAFFEWRKAHLQENKIAPLAQNWSFDKGFVEAWLDWDNNHPNIISSFFNYQARDLQRVALWFCDRAKLKGQSMPFGGVSLAKLAPALQVVNPAPHTAYGDCVTTALCYQKLVNM